MAVVQEYPPSYEEATSEDPEMRTLNCLCVHLPFHKNYATSTIGILKATKIIIAFIGFIAVIATPSWGCQVYGSPYGFFMSMMLNIFISYMLLYFFFVTKFYKKIPCIAWHMTEFIWCAVNAFCLLISSIMVVSQHCGKVGFQISSALGFILTLVICLTAYIKYKDWRNSGERCFWQRSQRLPATNEDSKY